MSAEEIIKNYLELKTKTYNEIDTLNEDYNVKKYLKGVYGSQIELLNTLLEEIQ